MAKLIVYYLLIFLIFPVKVKADCANPVTLLRQGELAQCDGYLFTLSKEQELYKMNEDYKLLKEELSVKNDQIDLYSKQVDTLKEALQSSEQETKLWKNAADDATSKYLEETKSKEASSLFLIGLGVVLTVAGGWAVGQAHPK